MQPQKFHGLPARPNLPPKPSASSASTSSHAAQRTTPAAPSVTQAVTAALNTPYSQQQHSSHYAQAYAQYYNVAQAQTMPAYSPQGYTYSSTYNPSYQQAQPGPSSSLPGYQDPNFPSTHGPGKGFRPNNKPYQHQHQQTNWYAPGTSRCTQSGCMFSGSAKSVEVHMMDRHLIYPPGWEKRKKRDEWDADPSLKGKTVLIQGTSLNLDDPENLAKWIEERKKRWPTAARVEEKKRKLDEAIARGQLHPDDPALRGQKRRRIEGEDSGGGFDGGRGRGRGRGRGFDRGRGRGAGGRGRGRGGGRGGMQVGLTAAPDQDGSDITMGTPKVSTTEENRANEDSSSSESDSEDDDGPPEMVSSKPPPIGLVPDVSSSSSEAEPEDEEHAGSTHPHGAPEETSNLEAPPQGQAEVEGIPPTDRNVAAIKPIRRPAPPQPKKPPVNPFGSHPSLLRNLLLPEIRTTVSNLSQAIHFLVINDFLDNVELKPGQAEEKLIEVVGESSTTDLQAQAEPSGATVGEETVIQGAIQLP